MSRTLIDYDAYLFDIDGTLLRPGSTIPGAIEALRALKANGKLIRAVTNNSRMAHHAVAARFRRYGLPLDDDEVFSALRATARFISHERPGATVFPFGAEGLIYELQEAGLTVTDQDNAEYVVAGYFPEINLDAMKQAMRALLNGARFVAVNTDRRYVGADGPIPGAGAFVAAIERASGSCGLKRPSRGPSFEKEKPRLLSATCRLLIPRSSIAASTPFSPSSASTRGRLRYRSQRRITRTSAAGAASRILRAAPSRIAGSRSKPQITPRPCSAASSPRKWPADPTVPSARIIPGLG